MGGLAAISVDLQWGDVVRRLDATPLCRTRSGVVADPVETPAEVRKDANPEDAKPADAGGGEQT